MVPQAQGNWWLISKIKQPWRKNIRQLIQVRVMDFRGITHPRHAGLPPMLPVNSGQPRLRNTEKNCIYSTSAFKEQPKDSNKRASNWLRNVGSSIFLLLALYEDWNIKRNQSAAR